MTAGTRGRPRGPVRGRLHKTAISRSALTGPPVYAAMRRVEGNGGRRNAAAYTRRRSRASKPRTNTAPSLATAARLAYALGCKPADLVDGVPPVTADRKPARHEVAEVTRLARAERRQRARRPAHGVHRVARLRRGRARAVVDRAQRLLAGSNSLAYATPTRCASRSSAVRDRRPRPVWVLAFSVATAAAWRSAASRSRA